MGGGGSNLDAKSSKHFKIDVSDHFLDFDDPEALALLSPEELEAEIEPSAKKDEVKMITKNLLERQVGLSAVDMDENSPSAISGKVQVRSGDNFKYKTYWGALKGTRLFLYKSEKSKKPSRTLWISYWEEEKFDSDIVAAFGEEHAENIVELEKYMGTFAFRCFTTQGLFSLKFENEEVGMEWNRLVLDMMGSSFMENELEEKRNLCLAFQRIMFEQTCEQLKGHRVLLTSLQEAGLGIDSPSSHPINSPSKIKFGYVKCLLGSDGDENDEDGVWNESWTRLYFILLPGHVYAYSRSSDPHPRQHLCVNKVGVERDSKDGNVLRVSTPLRTLSLKFGDEFQMFDWLHGLMKASKESNAGTLLADMHSDLNGTLVSLMTLKAPLGEGELCVKVRLMNDEDWTGKKAKVREFKLVKGGASVVVGREGNVGISLDDPNVSRAHAKIDVDSNGGCRIADLGSGNGTKVNGVYIKPHAALTAGDVVVVGKSTILTVGGEGEEGKVAEAVKYREKQLAEKSGRSNGMV